MEHRSPSLVAGLILALLGGVAAADEADWEQRLAQVSAMRAEADARLKSANAEFDRESLACQKKFLVNACVNKAREAQVVATRESRQQEIEASALEREVRREQVAARAARVTAENERRAQELPVREQSVAEERRQADEARQQALTDKQRKADARAQKRAEQAEAHRRKVAEHEARVAERKARAARRAADD
jgi:colicin import membrane protein